MDRQFHCKNKNRRNAVGFPKDADGNPIAPNLNGIDYLEVKSVDQKTLKIYFLHNLPGETNPVPPPPAQALTKENIRIDGGVRISTIQVESISASEKILTVVVNQAGDFSYYTLRLITSPTDLTPPAGFDPQLSMVRFSFKVSCPSEFDCKAQRPCPSVVLDEPEINYLAKDYGSFRRLILDRLSVIMPEWRERNAADLQMALVELLAYAGDQLSYFQDAVATEAYLGTARSRISVRRHARLLDYHMHDGCNARTWICVKVAQGGDAEGQELPEGTALLTEGADAQKIMTEANLATVLKVEKSIVFETLHPIRLYSSHNEISFYTWSDSECCLPRGSTCATLFNDPSLFLEPGDVLIFEEVYSPTEATQADADPTHRHAVRLKTVTPSEDPLNGIKVVDIEWHEMDALPFPLCLSALVPDPDGKETVREISVARGNVVLADHGATTSGDLQLPAGEPAKGYYSLKLPHKGISFSMPYAHASAIKLPLGSLLQQDPRQALPSKMHLTDADVTWTVQRDLLGSDRFKADFVVESEGDGTASLRFGDGVMGKKPSAGTKFRASYRIGNGRTGNVGARTITRIVTDFQGIEGVQNPLAATGGKDPETMEQVRQFAPFAFRTQERAVTETDYAEVTQRHPEVQKATATFRWTGSWHTVFITIDRKGGWEVDTEFKDAIRQHLEQYRLAGNDIEINGPVFVPLDIRIRVCVKDGYLGSEVKQRLLKVFSKDEFADGQQGFFHPDNFTFGQPVYLSQIYQAAMEVAGVAAAEVLIFQQWGKTPMGEMDKGFLKPGALEVIRLDNDPNFPENGKIDFKMHGGL